MARRRTSTDKTETQRDEFVRAAYGCLELRTLKSKQNAGQVDIGVLGESRDLGLKQSLRMLG